MDPVTALEAALAQHLGAIQRAAYGAPPGGGPEWDAMLRHYRVPALDLLKASFASFRGLVLLGAELHPNVKTLRDAGVKRVALGAGRYDTIPYAALQEEAVRMENEGLEARFYDLGKVGHTYLASDPAVLRDAIAWAGGKDD